MNPTDQRPEPGLPPELADRLRHLSEAQTRDSRPFPRLDTSVRRDRLTRFGGAALAGAAAAAVVAVSVLGGNAMNRADQSVPSRPTPTVSPTPTVEPSTLAQAGYPASTAGSLADDGAWLTGLREKLAADREKVDAADVHVVAAGDIEDRARFAVLLYSRDKKGKTFWGRDIWLGPVGAPVSGMEPVSTSGLPLEPNQVPHDPMSLFSAPGESRDSRKAVVVVSAPGADTPRIARARTFGVEGTHPKITTTRRDVPAVGGGTWAGSVDEDEFRMFDAEVTVGGVLTGGSAMSRSPGFDLAAVAVPGTDPGELDYLGGSLGGNRPTGAQVPIWAAVVPSGAQSKAAATLLRSPGGIYVAGFSEHQPAEIDPVEDDETPYDVTRQGYMVTSAAGDDDAMASVWIDNGTTHRYLVIAPAGATRVRVGEKTAAVKNRLAVIDVTVPNSESDYDDEGNYTRPEAPVAALAADGTVIQQQVPAAGEETTFTSEAGSTKDDGRSVIP
ncbi:hypothetical protein [Kineosporia succinea]|uniref:Uncharacterized protein n=1 Tax=Kineosporia succinea TaxID=84632 RepID=A0ABT9P3T6_9ACTN|nr:hypothetical protein [Kineosporia succinea]MDP9827221.1 hypothetical protein [Kineosporia succinea]